MSRSGLPRPSRPNNLLADAGSIALLGLVLLGIVGLAYRMLRPGGWLGGSLDYLWEKSPALVWLSGFGIVLIVAAARSFMFPRRKEVHHSDLLLYIGVALGLFFLFRLLATGSL
jgi:hypothetical protein